MTPAPSTIDTAPPWTEIGQHALLPEATHDEVARFNFIANFNKFMSARVVGGNQLAYERRAKAAYARAHGHEPRDRREIRAAMSTDPYYRMWSALRRNGMEMRQQAGRSLVLRQAEELSAKAKTYNEGAATLRLDPTVEVPRYQAAVDNHCMPGSYYAEYVADDVSAAANYDCGMFSTTTGLFGRYLDGAGRGTAAWLRRERPGWTPARILDIGCGLGHNTLPIAREFPRSEVIGVDISTPMLRYGHARAKALGVDNVSFVQANAEALPYAPGSFDFIYSTMFLHETSYIALRRILKEVERLLAPGGIHVHLEQPPYRGMPAFEQFLRDWDCYYNNEPFWTTVHDTNMPELLASIGNDGARTFETTIHALVDDAMPKVADQVEDYGRGGVWYAFGASRTASTTGR